MNKIVSDVTEFHEKFFPQTIGQVPAEPQDGQMEFRIKLMTEEFEELIEEMRSGDLVGVADGIIDTIYTLVGTGITYGLPLEKLWDEVHASNMSKDINRDGYYTTGKAFKGPNYFKPDIKKILEEANA
jgi:hypothetical protein